jgi:protein-S-isoprenylcysteine O-methyltransferase Ste14
MLTRIMFFAYGCLAYLLFLAVFLYAIAFVGGFAVPTTLDGALTTDLPTAVAIDIALLGVFAVQHSVMARRWFKRWWTQIVPWAIERSTYVLAASLALGLLFWQWRPLGGTVWTVDSPVLRGLVWAIYAYGWLQVLVMTFYINHFDLFGLRQVWLYLVERQYTRVGFATPPPYRFVRHPLYVGFLLAFWAAPTMTAARLIFAMVTTAYILVAIQFEERDLGHEHGAAYREYRRRVPMLFPRLVKKGVQCASSTFSRIPTTSPSGPHGPWRLNDARGTRYIC